MDPLLKDTAVPLSEEPLANTSSSDSTDSPSLLASDKDDEMILRASNHEEQSPMFAAVPALHSSDCATEPEAVTNSQDDDDDDEQPTNRTAATAPVTTTDMPTAKDGDESLSLPRISTAALGWYQIIALVHKNLLTKFRTPFATFMELFSPVLLMLVLVAAYNLSDITYKNATTYAEIKLSVPGPWLSLVEEAAGATTFLQSSNQEEEERRRLLFAARREQDDELQVSHHQLWHQWPAPNDVRNLIQSKRQERKRSLQFATDDQDLDDDGFATDDDDDSNADNDVYDVLNEARRQLSRLLKNPLPVPTFAEYVDLSLFLSSLFDTDDLPRVFSDSSYGREWGNLLTLGSLHLSPASDRTREFWSYLNESYPDIMQESLTVRVHETEQDAMRFIDQNLNERTWALLDFSSWAGETEDASFKIRMNYTTLPNTNEITDFVSIGLNKAYQRYYLSGFLTLQRTLNEFAFVSSEGSCAELVPSITGDVWSMPMPTASYSQNTFYLAVGYLLGLTIVMAYLYPTSRLIKSIVEEKETRMKETMLIMGLRPWAHWLSWLLTSLLVFFVIAVFVTLALSMNVLGYSSTAYLFIFVWLFSTASIGFCFMLAALFSRAKLASIVGPMSLFATILPRFIFFGSNRYEATAAKMWASLLPATAFAFGADIIADYEYAEQGIQSWNAGEGDYSFNTALGFLFFDTLMYIFLGWYFDQVIPSQYGSARPFYFILSPRYWCSCFFPHVKRELRGARSVSNETEPDSEGEQSLRNNEKTIDPSLVPRVEIRNLVKRYDKKKSSLKPAVDDLNFTLYESQITTLLGHNGAGKTTTVSLLTGLFPPTSGDCVIYGDSIVSDKVEARRSVGICSQQNILFERLTVLETISFFRRIKGVRTTRADVKAQAEEVGLHDFFHTTASALSGGNKRKLSLAIALCGDPRFLLLDEPTSGMDPSSRRACWDVLRKKRIGRVILLTTHFMDEAELLSDRIAVLKEGVLQCSGSPLFLKNRYGLGYNLTVVIEPGEAICDGEDPESMGESTEESDGVVVDAPRRLESFLQQYVPGTTLARSFGKEISFRLPKGLENAFPDAFDALELESRRLGVGSFGIENASLEEVFLLLGDEANEPVEAELGDVVIPSSQTHHLSRFGQVGLLYWKRLVIQKRDLKGFFFSILVPVLLVGLVLLVLTINVPLAGPAIEVSPSLYERSSNDMLTAGAGVPIAGMPPSSSDVIETETTVYSGFPAHLAETYPTVGARRLENSSTSQDLSALLLATYSDGNGRYAAYVMNDIINATVAVDWDALENDIYSISENQALRDMESIDLIELLASEDAPGVLLLDLSVADAASTFYAATDLVANATVNATDLRLLLASGLQDIFLSTLSTAGPSNFTEWNGALRLTLSQLHAAGSTTSGSNLTAVIDIVAQASSDADGLFNERIVARATSDVLVGAVGLFGGDVDNATYDGILLLLNEVPPSLTVALVITADTMLDQLIQTEGQAASVTLGEVFAGLSEVLGGSASELDGSVTLETTNATLDLSTAMVVLSGLQIVSDATILADLEDGSSLNVTIKQLGALLPDGRGDYHFEISAAASLLHNSSSPHAVGAFNQALMGYLFRSCTGNDDSRLISINHPLPLTTQQAIEVQTILSILASMFLLIPYCYIPGAFIVFLVKERTCKSKHLQLVSGVNMGSYWIAHYLWDVTLFLILTVCVMILFLVYSVDDAAVVFVGDVESFWCTFFLTFGYGLSVLPFTYLLSRGFTNHSSAQIAVIGVVFITGFVAVNAYFIMSSIEDTKRIAEAMVPLFRSWPAFNVGEGFIRMSQAYWERRVLFEDNSPFDWDVAGKSLAIIYMLVIPYSALLLTLEYAHDGGAGGMFGRMLRHVQRRSSNMMLRIYGVRNRDGALLLDDGLDEKGNGHDDDVEEERLYVSENSSELQDSASILFVDLWKIYPPSVGLFGVMVVKLRRCFGPVLCCFCRLFGANQNADDREEERRGHLPKRAVRGVTTSVMKGETYALLGINGAGKTSILSVLTGDTPATSGKVFVAGHDITGEEENGVTEARKNIGLCPQEDPLLDLMTGRETLRMFARLRGVAHDRIEADIERLMKRLTLTPHADKVSQAYSGGNKRKLSLGIALIGDPKVLLIDESSSGLDPAAKRHMWNLISEVSRDRSVILTTHSMQEAEALATRAGIMANGQLLCLGSVQHLKNKYLDGYTIDVFCNSGCPETQVDAVVTELLENALPGSRLVERHGRFVRIDIRSLSSLGLGTTFRRLQALKADPQWNVENYSIRQCSLEQVFIQLVGGPGAVPTANDEQVAEEEHQQPES